MDELSRRAEPNVDELTDIVIADDDRPARDDLVALYASVGWTAYTRAPELLETAIAGSLRVVTARRDGALVGLARAVGDGATIAYVQDILVVPALQRSGVGRRLVTALLEPWPHVRQKVLITDAEPQQRAFYESLGFREIRDLDAGGLRAFVRFD